MQRNRRNTENDFWNLVEKSRGCWIWQGHINWEGYGVITMNRKKFKTHRLSYMYKVGNIPEGLVVCHKCDTPACVNPKHLFLGTREDNRADAMRKGRQATGERVHTARLKNNQVVAIRESKLTTSELAKKYGVARYLIQRVLARRTYVNI